MRRQRGGACLHAHDAVYSSCDAQWSSLGVSRLRGRHLCGLRSTCAGVTYLYVSCRNVNLSRGNGVGAQLLVIRLLYTQAHASARVSEPSDPLSAVFIALPCAPFDIVFVFVFQTRLGKAWSFAKTPPRQYVLPHSVLYILGNIIGL